jgi:uncharacterized protein YndB with AHSA1/START domain
MSHSPANPQPGDHGIVSTRLFPQSRARVFAAHADPLALAAWWGPNGFTNVFHAFDFRPGGAWRFTMHGPDGASYVMDHLFTEIVAPERIVVRHIQQGHDFLLTMTFTERAGGTEVTWRMLFDDPAEGARLRDFIAAANAQNLDRLAAHLSVST